MKFVSLILSSEFNICKKRCNYSKEGYEVISKKLVNIFFIAILGGKGASTLSFST